MQEKTSFENSRYNEMIFRQTERRRCYMYTYVWYHWITFFFIYCFIGWFFESTYVSLKKKHFVNRGFLRLPMLPLYGSGALMMLWVSLPIQDNLVMVYISGIIGATVLEYVTGSVMEQLFKVRYWDYSNQKFNVHGYICLSSSLAWGFLTILMTRVLHQPVERFVLALSPAQEFSFIGIVGALFLVDTIQSTREALSLARALEAITKMRSELEELQVRIALLKSETVQQIDNLKAAQRLKADEYKKVQLQKAAEYRNVRLQKATEFKERARQSLSLHLEIPQLTRQLHNLAEKQQKLASHLSFYRRGILRGNPGATSRYFAAALKELKEAAEQYKK